jgi:hypothetical protein
VAIDVVRGVRLLSFRRGLRGGHRAWIAVGIAAWGIGRLRASAGPELVAREELKPGQRLIISHGTRTIDIE